MTTIVAAQTEHGSVIMADSALNFFTQNDEATHQVYSPSKLKRHGELVIGLAGDVRATMLISQFMTFPSAVNSIQELVDLMNSQVALNEAVEAIDGDWDMVVACPYGIVSVCADWAYEPPSGLHAIGTGFRHALPVLHALDRKQGTMPINETDVRLAMDIAIKMDPFSCGPVIWERCRKA